VIGMVYGVSCRPRSSAEARDAARSFLASLHLSENGHAAQNLLMVVAELVANALRHAGTVLELRFSREPDGLVVAVDDPSPRYPLPRLPDWTGRAGGFGWVMVQRLAGQVRIRPREGGGKTVEAVVAV
jgi:anti-sigma regulatory factor (Ser/Thr protein kinase)